MKILLIAGGWSTERDVSLNGAKNIEKALSDAGNSVTLIDIRDEFDSLLIKAKEHDFAFINLHGAPGEDGLIQAMLAAINCPYQGSGPAGSFLALNKAAAKQIFRLAGLPTANWQFLPVSPPPDWRPALPYPLFVKSNTGGSSLHLFRADNFEELANALFEIFEANEQAIIETEIRGKEITCGILNDTPLPPLLIEPVAGDFFDFASKYQKGGAREICPAPISENQTREIQSLALAAHNALGLYGYSRADFILDAQGKFTLLEVNTLPGMTATSLLPQEAAQAGLDFSQLLQTLIEAGLKRKI